MRPAERGTDLQSVSEQTPSFTNGLQIRSTSMDSTEDLG
jgi:hypothetical protein